MTMNANQIATVINAGKGPGDLVNSGDTIDDMAKRHSDLVDRIHALQRKMEPHWEGKAADAAFAGYATRAACTRSA